MSEARSGGLGLGGVLTVLFVVFKIFGVINWSWWWVFAPALISTGLGLFLIFLGLLMVLLGVRRN